MKKIFDGIFSFVLHPTKNKFFGFLIVIAIMAFIVIDKENMTVIRYFALYLLLPAYFFILGTGNNSKNSNNYSNNNKNNIVLQNENDIQENETEIVDRLEKRTITTNRTETIETVYFRNGQQYADKKTYYFKGDR